METLMYVYVARRKENIMSVATRETLENVLVEVKIQSVTKADKFMRCKLKNVIGRRIKKHMEEAIDNEMKNFCIPAIDPSFADDGETIVYCAGRRPAVGKSPLWWYENAKLWLPERQSALCNEMEDDIVLAVMVIKPLVEMGYEVDQAWLAVINDSKEIGHFCNSLMAKYDFEATGSRKLGDIYDLGNTGKIVKKEGIRKLEMRGGNFTSNGKTCAIGKAITINDFQKPYNFSVGRIRADVIK